MLNITGVSHFTILKLCISVTTDAPIPLSRHNDDSLAFDGRTANVSGPAGEEISFKIAVRCFPTPARFEWPPSITLVKMQSLIDDVTVFELSVAPAANDVSLTLTGRNSASVRLTSTIVIDVFSGGRYILVTNAMLFL